MVSHHSGGRSAAAGRSRTRCRRQTSGRRRGNNLRLGALRVAWPPSYGSRPTLARCDTPDSVEPPRRRRPALGRPATVDTWDKSRGPPWRELTRSRPRGRRGGRHRTGHPAGSHNKAGGAAARAGRQRLVALEPVGATRCTPTRRAVLPRPRRIAGAVLDCGRLAFTHLAARRRIVAVEPRRTIKPPTTPRTPGPDLHRAYLTATGGGATPSLARPRANTPCAPRTNTTTRSAAKSSSAPSRATTRT